METLLRIEESVLMSTLTSSSGSVVVSTSYETEEPTAPIKISRLIEEDEKFLLELL